MAPGGYEEGERGGRGGKGRGVLSGTRQSTFRRGRARSVGTGKAFRAKMKFKKLKLREGEAMMGYMEDMERDAGNGENAGNIGMGERRRAEAGNGRGNPEPEVGSNKEREEEKEQNKRNRTKEKKAFFKKTRTGQPVMKTRIDKLLETIKKG